MPFLGCVSEKGDRKKKNLILIQMSFTNFFYYCNTLKTPIVVPIQLKLFFLYNIGILLDLQYIGIVTYYFCYFIIIFTL
jgi:hypothetical protein